MKSHLHWLLIVSFFLRTRLPSAHPNLATLICTSRPVLTLRISKLFTPVRYKTKRETFPTVSVFLGLIDFCAQLYYILNDCFLFLPARPLPTYLFPFVVVVAAVQAYTDVIFITGSVGFSAHRFYIAAAAPSLARLIATATANSDINCSDIGTRSSSDCSMVRYRFVDWMDR